MEHINSKKCKTGKCSNLVQYIIVAEKCIGCTVCATKCPVKCISGEKKRPHIIDQKACVKCGECFNACKFKAIIRG